MRRCPSFSDRPAFPSGLRVLIIDNNVPHLNSAKQMLQSCEYEVTTCSSRADALRVLRADSNVFDVVLVDLVMVTEGKDANKVIQAIHNRSLPVVSMTDSDKTDSVMKGIRLGTVQVLRKPLPEFQVKKLWYHAVRKEAKKKLGVNIKGATSSSSVNEIPNKGLKGLKPGKGSPTSASTVKGESALEKMVSDYGPTDSIFARDLDIIHEEVKSLYSQDVSVEGFEIGGSFGNVLGKENENVFDDCGGSIKSSSCSEVGLEMDRGSVESNGSYALNQVDGNGQRPLAVRPSMSNQFPDGYAQQGNSQMWQYPINQNRYKQVVSVPAQQDPWGAPILPSMAAHCQALAGRSEQTAMGNALLAESYPPPRPVPVLGCVKDIGKKSLLGLHLEKSPKFLQQIMRSIAKESNDRRKH